MSLNIFDQVYVLNAGASTASSLMSQTYEIAFQDLNFGQGYALSLLATVTTIVLSLLDGRRHLSQGGVLMRRAPALRLGSRGIGLWSLLLCGRCSRSTGRSTRA